MVQLFLSGDAYVVHQILVLFSKHVTGHLLGILRSLPLTCNISFVLVSELISMQIFDSPIPFGLDLGTSQFRSANFMLSFFLRPLPTFMLSSHLCWHQVLWCILLELVELFVEIWWVHHPVPTDVRCRELALSVKDDVGTALLSSQMLRLRCALTIGRVIVVA